MNWIPFSKAAEQLSVSTRTLHRWAKMQKPPFPMRKIGGHWRIKLEGEQ